MPFGSDGEVFVYLIYVSPLHLNLDTVNFQRGERESACAAT